ncbi:MAG: mitochondrial fission ELM1 family protein [Myxococcota bacterium]
MRLDPPDSSSPSREGSAPQVWLLMGEKPGDNAQIRNLAEAIGFPATEKNVVVHPKWQQGKPRVKPSISHIDLDRSDPLEGPWPDLVITAGRRLSSVGMWIKKASEGRTKLVMIGKPRRLLDSVDMIVVAAHYVLTPGENRALHDLPFMHVDQARLEAAVGVWESKLQDLPRPLTALMVGGPTGGLKFDLETARDLFQKTLRDVEENSGSLYITTSRRTPAKVVEMLRRECPDSARLYVFDADGPPEENPYFGLLGLADHFAVTTDSVSMMVEVVRLGRALSIYPLESSVGVFEQTLASLGLVRPLSAKTDPLPAGGLRARTFYRLGRPVHSRDLSAIPRLLVRKGLAGWLGEPRVTPVAFEDDELEQVARRVRALVEERGAPPA